jgi:transcription termination factor Rho
LSVLQRSELEGSPLADLHAIASELSIESYRGLRKAELIKAILEAQGGEAEPPAAEEAAEPEPEQAPVVESEPEPEAEPEDAERGPVEEEPEVQEEPLTEEETATGVLDVLPNGSGFVRVDTDTAQSRDDVYISPAQIRRCELRAGDEVSGPVRPPRRNERHPSLIRVETVNGSPAEPPEERPRFADLTPVFPTERLEGPAALADVPFGRGSRVAVGGPPGAGATTLLRELAVTLADKHPEIEVTVMLAGVRPEEVTDWRRSVGVPVAGGSFDRSPEQQAQAADLAAERAKRVVERGGHAALVVDSLEGLPAAVQRRVFGAARATEEGGSLTVAAAIGMAWEPQRVATTRVMLDPPTPDSRGPQVSAARSATLRADLLGA